MIPTTAYHQIFVALCWSPSIVKKINQKKIHSSLFLQLFTCVTLCRVLSKHLTGGKISSTPLQLTTTDIIRTSFNVLIQKSRKGPGHWDRHQLTHTKRLHFLLCSVSKTENSLKLNIVIVVSGNSHNADSSFHISQGTPNTTAKYITAGHTLWAKADRQAGMGRSTCIYRVWHVHFQG